MDLTSQDEMTTQYSTPGRLRTRAAVWRPAPGSVGAREAVVQAVADLAPRTVLDVGCGDGALTAQVAAAVPDAQVCAVDLSPGMVEATRARGLRAVVASVDALPVESASQDCVTCCWMLYHAPDLDAAIAELARVVHPEGAVVVATAGPTHLHDLYELAGLTPRTVPFAGDLAEAALRRHLARVERAEHPSLARFETRADAAAYLATLPGCPTGDLPQEGWPRDVRGHATIFTCRP